MIVLLNFDEASRAFACGLTRPQALSDRLRVLQSAHVLFDRCSHTIQVEFDLQTYLRYLRRLNEMGTWRFKTASLARVVDDTLAASRAISRLSQWGAG